jgi:hypothetical protein
MPDFLIAVWIFSASLFQWKPRAQSSAARFGLRDGETSIMADYDDYIKLPSSKKRENKKQNEAFMQIAKNSVSNGHNVLNAHLNEVMF